MRQKHKPNIDKPTCFIFMGLSGSGKDTQARMMQNLLEQRSNPGSVLNVYAGQKIKQVASSDTYTARLIVEWRKVKKIDGFLAIWSWADDFIHNLKESQHIILSSSPRSLLEAKILDDSLLFYGIDRVYPVYLKVDRSEALRRAKERGRIDDVDGVIKDRFDWFDSSVMPAIEYYRNLSKNKLIEIDANSRGPQELHREIARASNLY